MAAPPEGRGSPSRLLPHRRLPLRQVNAGGQPRWLGVVRPPPSLAWSAAVVVVVAGAALVLSGHGGFDGALGVAVAFVVLVGAAAAIQRLTKPSVPFGFNPDGVYARRLGWIPWDRVRRIEVRRHRNRLGGWRTTLWVGFEPEPSAAELAWTSITPGWGPRRVTELADRLEALWAHATRPRAVPAARGTHKDPRATPAETNPPRP